MRLFKLILIYVIALFFLAIISSCSKNSDAVPRTPVKTDTLNVAEKHDGDHDCTHNHPDGQLCTGPLAGKVANYTMEGKNEEAIKVLVEAKDVPGYQWDAKKIYESMIYLYDKAGQYEKNLEVWKDGHNKGLVFAMDSMKAHFKPYLKLEGFQDIYNKDIDMQKKNNINRGEPK